MAKSSKALGKIKKPKQSGNVKFIKDWVMNPTSPVDVAMTFAGVKAIKPAAKITKRAVGGIAKAGAKYVGKVYRNIG
jgi:hypothetical protein